MKLHLLHKDLSKNIEFSRNQEKEFIKLWHYHPQLEIVYINKGEGTLYAGDFIGRYQKDDLFILGKNVPHMFYSIPYSESKGLSEAYVLHINELFLNQISNISNEFSFVHHIIKLAKNGVMFRNKKVTKLLKLWNNLGQTSPSEQTLRFLFILLQLSEINNHTSLGSINWLKHFQISDARINNVIEYVMLNFKKDLSLDKAADISGMNKSAFCRYFKKNTGKSFVSFQNGIRINYSCKILKEKDPIKTISEACYQSGFNSLSYYHRTFKKTIGLSPSQYQNKETVL